MVTEEGSSSSTPVVGHKYDVFINFCDDDDIRYVFVDGLYGALQDANISSYMDNGEIAIGEDQQLKSESAIKASRASIIVLSKIYANSTQSLDELVLILEQRRTSNHIVVPIFYHVEPNIVRRRLSSFGDAMTKHRQIIEAVTDVNERPQRAQKLDQWHQALMEVANLGAMKTYGRREMKFIQDIVKEINSRLRISPRSPLPLDPSFHPEMKQSNHPEIPLQDIKICTQDFNERNLIGKGGFGRVYKGILTWGDHVNQLVAVKRLDVAGFQGNKEFNTELTMLSQYRHENIINLVGFCVDNKEMILVYEYASNGSLDTHLLNPSAGLSWPQLLKICIDVASALDYVHNHVGENHRIIHRDIKRANILLDENWNAKLADFGLAKIGLANQQNTYVITNLAGTHGYCDPQYERTGFLTKESDVYSFGVVLFEVLCGRLVCVVSYHDERRFLHRFAPTCYKNGEMDKIIDIRIRNNIKPQTLSMFSAIAYQCLQETREERHTIAEVAFQLKEAMKIQVED